MKKISIIALVGIVFAGAANAGLLESLGLAKKAEPQTLGEACDTDEIKKICPEILLGTMTMADCVKQNVSQLSKQCSDYVKKSIANGGEELKAKLAAAQESATAGSDGLKDKLTAAKDAAAAESDAAKAEREAKAAELKQAASDTVENAKRTGELIKGMF